MVLDGISLAPEVHIVNYALSDLRGHCFADFGLEARRR